MIRSPLSSIAITTPPKASKPVDAAAGDPALERACKDFEAVFLRQLLEVSKVGQQAGAGYGSMVVDALATSVNDAGGLGLSDRIRAALESKA